MQHLLLFSIVIHYLMEFHST